MNNSHKGFERPMNFGIESKINKEDIVDRVIPDRKSHRNENVFEEKNKEENSPLLKVEVNLDEKNNTDKIIIYPGDDIREKTIQFCVKHKLSEEKKNTLLNIILEKMKETQNENVNKDKDMNDKNYQKKDKEKEKEKNNDRIDIKNNLNNKEIQKEENINKDKDNDNNDLYEEIEGDENNN